MDSHLRNKFVTMTTTGKVTMLIAAIPLLVIEIKYCQPWGYTVSVVYDLCVRIFPPFWHTLITTSFMLNVTEMIQVVYMPVCDSYKTWKSCVQPDHQLYYMEYIIPAYTRFHIGIT